MPSNVQNGTFTSCDGDLQDPVGIYVVGGVSKYLSFLFRFSSFLGGLCLFIFIFSCSIYLVYACNVKRSSSIHTTCSCFIELPNIPSYRSLRSYIHREFFLILISFSHLLLIKTFLFIQSSTAATVTGTKGSGGSGASGGSGTGSGSGSTSTSASSSAVSLMSGVPSTAFCALGLGVLAGIALVF